MKYWHVDPFEIVCVNQFYQYLEARNEVYVCVLVIVLMYVHTLPLISAHSEAGCRDFF